MDGGVGDVQFPLGVRWGIRQRHDVVHGRHQVRSSSPIFWVDVLTKNRTHRGFAACLGGLFSPIQTGDRQEQSRSVFEIKSVGFVVIFL